VSSNPPFHVVKPADLAWQTRPHEAGEPARHVAELSDLLHVGHVRANIWRYEPGASGKRHVHSEQEETFVVLSGTLTIYLGELPERIDVPGGGVVNVAGGTPLQSANHGDEDLVVYAYGYPPDEGAEVLASAL
jgi:mannose-6-phosphate isomerase-like protein (cupin superfamily)